MRQGNTILRVAAFLGAVAVLLGAFAAHGLKDRISQQALAAFETGVKYQFYHVFALLLTGLLLRSEKHARLLWAARFFLVGILLFSGSLYYLTVIQELRWLRWITPLGGLSFIVGWLFLFAYLSLKPGVREG